MDVVDVADGMIVEHLLGHPDAVERVMCLPDGSLLGPASHDRTGRLCQALP